MWVLFPIIVAPTWGVKNVLELFGIKPNPTLPITVLGEITTYFPIKENSIKTLEPIKVCFPILQFFDIVVLSEI